MQISGTQFPGNEAVITFAPDGVSVTNYTGIVEPATFSKEQHNHYKGVHLKLFSLQTINFLLFPLHYSFGYFDASSPFFILNYDKRNIYFPLQSQSGTIKSGGIASDTLHL